MLEELKLLLGIEKFDTSQDEKLNLIIDSVSTRLRVLLEGADVPESLKYVVTEVSVIRFNKIGSEGLSSHSVEGETMSFADNDFAGYMDEIEAFLSSQKEAKKGKVRFI